MALREQREKGSRLRFVRVGLTDVQHCLLRTAAAEADLSLSQYAVRAVVGAAEVMAEERTLAARLRKKPKRASSI